MNAQVLSGSRDKLCLLKVTCAAFGLLIAAAITAPAQTFTTLVGFDGTNGAMPNGLMQGADGNFYGTTSTGGANTCVSGGVSAGCGTVFKMDSHGTLTTLYNFCSLANCADGSDPLAGLVQGTDGNLYGTTGGSGAYGRGTIFKITPAGQLTTLHSLSLAEGFWPDAPLVQGTDGNFYGAAPYGGTFSNANGSGTIFKITPAGVLTTLYSFCSQGGVCTDGYYPTGGLVLASDGNFYGTTEKGGTENAGTVFQITPAGTLTTIHSFCTKSGPIGGSSGCLDGGSPSGLIQASDGNLYGTSGIPTGIVVFRINTGGTLTMLAAYTNGGGPNGLVEADNGNFYGTTYSGGTNMAGHNATCSGPCGTIFEMTPSGIITTLYNFCSQTGCPDGSGPVDSLVEGTNGILYGTTYYGGDSSCSISTTIAGCGTVFSLTVPPGLMATAVSLSLAPSTITAGAAGPIVMTATVTPFLGGGTPTGTITFFNGSTQIWTGVLSGGVATLDYDPSALGVYLYSITASYGGDSTFAASTSSPQMLTVMPAGTFTLSVNPTSLTIVAGQSGQATITITPQNGFDSEVDFSVTGQLPSDATSIRLNPMFLVPSGGNPVTTTLTITTTASTATVRAPMKPPQRQLEVLLCAFLVMLFVIAPRRRRVLRSVQVCGSLIFLLAALGLASCGMGGGGGGGGGGGKPMGTGTGTLTVTATTMAPTGAIAISQTTTMTVTITQ